MVIKPDLDTVSGGKQATARLFRRKQSAPAALADELDGPAAVRQPLPSLAPHASPAGCSTKSIDSCCSSNSGLAADTDEQIAATSRASISSTSSWHRFWKSRSGSAGSSSAAIDTTIGSDQGTSCGLNGAQGGCDASCTGAGLGRSESAPADIAAGAGSQQQQWRRGWKHRMKKLLSHWFIFDAAELRALQVDRRELQALHTFGIDRATYRATVAGQQRDQYSVEDWAVLEDILVFHNSKGTRRAHTPLTISGQTRDSQGWWHLTLDRSSSTHHHHHRSPGASAATCSSSASSSASIGEDQPPSIVTTSAEGIAAASPRSGTPLPGAGTAADAAATSVTTRRQLDLAIWYAGFDQCSKEAQGAASCGCCALEVARWLACHHGAVPSQQDTMSSLIKRGAAHWRSMRRDPSLASSFANGHFDLETVVAMQPQPAAAISAVADGRGNVSGTGSDSGAGGSGPMLRLVPERSFVGFLRPPGRRIQPLEQLLEGSMPVEHIWQELHRLAPATFIVAWNDHFCVLRVEEGGAAFLIDSLGARLHSFCCCAFVVRFNPDAAMSTQPAPALPRSPVAASSVAASSATETQQQQEERQGLEPRSAIDKLAQFFGRAYTGSALANAAKAARQREEQQQQGGGGDWPELPALLHKLQVEFHCVEPL